MGNEPHVDVKMKELKWEEVKEFPNFLVGDLVMKKKDTVVSKPFNQEDLNAIKHNLIRDNYDQPPAFTVNPPTEYWGDVEVDTLITERDVGGLLALLPNNESAAVLDPEVQYTLDTVAPSCTGAVSLLYLQKILFDKTSKTCYKYYVDLFCTMGGIEHLVKFANKCDCKWTPSFPLDFDIQRAILSYLIFSKIIRDQHSQELNKFNEDISERFVSSSLHIKCIKFSLELYKHELNKEKSKRGRNVIKHNIALYFTMCKQYSEVMEHYKDYAMKWLNQLEQYDDVETQITYLNNVYEVYERACTEDDNSLFLALDKNKVVGTLKKIIKNIDMHEKRPKEYQDYFNKITEIDQSIKIKINN